MTYLAGLPFLLIIFFRAFLSGNFPDIAVFVDGFSGSPEQQAWQFVSMMDFLRTEAIGVMNDLPYSSFIMPFMHRYHLVGIDPIEMYNFTLTIAEGNIVDQTSFLAALPTSPSAYLVEQRNVFLDISKGLVIAILFSLFGGLFSKQRKSLTLTFFTALINFSIICVIAVCVSAAFNQISLLSDVAAYILLFISCSCVVTTMIMMLRKKCSKFGVEFKLSSSIGSVFLDGILKPFVRTVFMIFAIACFLNAYLGSQLSVHLMARTLARPDVNQWDLIDLNFNLGILPMVFVIGAILMMVLIELMDNKFRTKLQVSLSAKMAHNVPFPQTSFPQPYTLQYPPPQASFSQPSIRQHPPQESFQQSNQPASSPKKFCTQCGVALDEGSQFCSGCGTKIN